MFYQLAGHCVMTSHAPDPATIVYRLEVKLGSVAAVLIALLGCCAVLANIKVAPHALPPLAHIAQ